MQLYMDNRFGSDIRLDVSHNEKGIKPDASTSERVTKHLYLLASDRV